MASKYVVTYRPERGENIEIKLMSGGELTKLYGTSDDFRACEFYVWKVNENGDFDRCRLRENEIAPHNLLCIQNNRTMEVEIYEWDEH